MATIVHHTWGPMQQDTEKLISAALRHDSGESTAVESTCTRVGTDRVQVLVKPERKIQ